GTQTVDLSVSGLPSVSFSASAGPSPNTGNPNEPPGFTKLTERSFNAPLEDGWTARADPYYQIVADPSGPKSPGSIGRAIFPKGFVGGSGPILLARSFTPSRRLYISAWFRMSANWQGHRSGVNKIFHVWMDGRNKAVPTAMGIDSNPLAAQVNAQGLNETPQSRRLDPQTNLNIKITKGIWHRFEILIGGNTPGVADGTAKWWLDGNLIGDYSNINWVAAGHTNLWDTIYWNPTWGGVQDTVLQDQYMDMDHIYISGGP
ncbi:MAG TPA: hypothetical protein VNH46_13555, partial [Gemmatimonadales bacterium]|nr:hypothetical protein [Gemmatimonadales bacterium]